MRELLEPRVEALDVEESDLVGGRGFQLGAPIALEVGADATWEIGRAHV